MKKRGIALVLTALTLAACSNTEQEAQARLDKARTMYEQGEYFAAKSEIDSIRTHYPKEFDVLKASLGLMRQVELKEAERTLAFCDSLIPIKQHEADSLSKAFVLERDSLYEEIGTYIWKQQTVERNVQRCYIRCGVNERGEMYLASVFYGARPLEHTGIRLSTPNDLFAETASIPYDGGVNYRFKDMGNTTEVVTYKGDHGLDAIKFIFTNEKERIKVAYTGGKPYTLYMADADKRSIVATYTLATVLSDMENMRKESDKARKKVDYLQRKLSQTTESTALPDAP